MKIFFFLFAMIFSASVLADCCNFEVEEASYEQRSTVDEAHHDDCGTEAEHSDSSHCHCSPINHFKIIVDFSIPLMTPRSIDLGLIPVRESKLESHYHASIFQPPIS